MIRVTKLDGETLHVSPHQIEFIEENPDTVLMMISGRKIIVRENADEIVERVIDYRSKLGSQQTMTRTTELSEGS